MWQRDARGRIRALLRSVDTSVQSPCDWQRADGTYADRAAERAADIAAKVAAIVALADSRAIRLSYGDLTVAADPSVMWVGVQGRRQVLFDLRSYGGERYETPRPSAVLSFADASKERDAWRRERDAARRKREVAPAERQAQQWAQLYEQHGGVRRRWGY
ncbi:MAG: hypothetical protein GY772_06925 [bacterium]|nr:hypothetical protein [bacterium]